MQGFGSIRNALPRRDDAIYDPCAPGSRMVPQEPQWETAVRKHPELIGLLDGIHFHTLCEQDSSDLETTLTAVKTKFGDLISQMKMAEPGRRTSYYKTRL